MFCTNCGAVMDHGDSFCANCGQKALLAVQSPGPITASPQPVSHSQDVPASVQTQSFPTAQTDLGNDASEWIQGFTGKSNVKIYADVHLNSSIVAHLPLKSPLLLGQEVKAASGRWHQVKLPDGKIGYIVRSVPILSQKGMVSTIKSWAYGMIFIGALSILLSSFLDPIWGALLIVIGIVALIVKKRAMFLVFGLALVYVGLMNMLVGGQWVVFGVMQILWGIAEFYKFSLYGVLRQGRS